MIYVPYPSCEKSTFYQECKNTLEYSSIFGSIMHESVSPNSVYCMLPGKHIVGTFLIRSKNLKLVISACILFIILYYYNLIMQFLTIKRVV